MNAASTCFVPVGCLCAALGVADEWSWWRRKGGKVVKGRVIAHVSEPSVDGGVMFMPRVEFEWQGSPKAMVLRHGAPEPIAIGTSVNVMVGRWPDDAEIVTVANRWLFTVVPFGFGLVLAFTGMGIRP